MPLAGIPSVAPEKIGAVGREEGKGNATRTNAAVTTATQTRKEKRAPERSKVLRGVGMSATIRRGTNG
jgi:hypothetical protein